MATRRNWATGLRVLVIESACLTPLLLAAGCTPPNLGGNAPSANAGPDQGVAAGTSVTLDGSGSSDPDGDELVFAWKQTGGKAVSLTSNAASGVAFTAPATGASLAFELTVSDGRASSTDVINVSVHPADPSARVHEFRPPFSVRDDPAVNGNFPDTWTLGEAPTPLAAGAESEEKGKRPAQAGPPVEEELAPGAAHEAAFDVGGPARLVGSVRWIGTRSPLDVVIVVDDATVAVGETYAFGHDRGGAYADATASNAGRAALIVTNTTDVSVKVRVFFAVYGPAQE